MKNDLKINYGRDKEKNMEELALNGLSLLKAYTVSSKQVSLFTSMTKEIVKITSSEPMDETKNKINKIIRIYLHEINEQCPKLK